MPVKRFYKSNPIEEYHIGGELNGHIFAFSRIGCLDEDTEIIAFTEDELNKLEELEELDEI